MIQGRSQDEGKDAAHVVGRRIICQKESRRRLGT